MSQQNECDAEMKKNVIRTYCDGCRGEILAPFLGHVDAFGFEDLCTGCYDREYHRYQSPQIGDLVFA